MTNYNYREAVKNDVKDYIENEVNLDNYATLDELVEDLNDSLWIDDSVTGNGSGSYWFSTYKAEEALCHNLELLGEALAEFGSGADYLIEHGAEECDVTIRCYLLGEAISEALEEMDINEETFEDRQNNDGDTIPDTYEQA